MIYAAMTFWLLVIVFVAYGVYQLWAGLLRPKTINVLLLPGTLIAQIGHVVGLLVTGGTINDTSLMKNDESGAPGNNPKAKSQIPVIGPVVVALLPILACGFSIYVVLSTMGREVLPVEAAQPTRPVSDTIPTDLSQFWAFIRDSITVVEQVTNALFNSDFTNWRTWLFLYLLVCLSVRMAPLPGTHRGAVAAILILGIAAAMIGLAMPMSEQNIHAMWDMLSFAVAVLLFLMIISLIVRGGIGLFRMMTDDA